MAKRVQCRKHCLNKIFWFSNISQSKLQAIIARRLNIAKFCRVANKSSSIQEEETLAKSFSTASFVGIAGIAPFSVTVIAPQAFAK